MRVKIDPLKLEIIKQKKIIWYIQVEKTEIIETVRVNIVTE